MTEHLQNSALKVHMRNIHRNILKRLEIVKIISCIKKFDNVKKQKHTMTILKYRTSINKQNEDFSNVVKL